MCVCVCVCSLGRVSLCLCLCCWKKGRKERGVGFSAIGGMERWLNGYSLELFLTSRELSSNSSIILIPSLFRPAQESMFHLQIYTQHSSTITKLENSVACASVQGQWTDQSAGGCMNHDSWMYNPQYLVKTSQSVDVIVSLQQKVASSQAKNFIGFYVLDGRPSNGLRILTDNATRMNKPSFQNAMEVSACVRLEAHRPSVILPCPFDTGKHGQFLLSVTPKTPSVNVSLAPVTEWNCKVVRGRWSPGCAGGCTNNSTWRQNPTYAFVVRCQPGILACEVHVSLRVALGKSGAHYCHASESGIGFYILSPASNSILKKVRRSC